MGAHSSSDSEALRPSHSDRYAASVSIERILGIHGNVFAQPLPFHFRLPNGISAKDAIAWTFRQYLNAREEGREFVWLDEYDEVADWLSDNHGRGLLLYGHCGLGKTLLARHILPFIYERVFRRLFRHFDASDLTTNLDYILSSNICTIDDVGTEPISQFRSVGFADVVDQAEKKNRLLIITTNLDAEGLKERYGDRVIDRLAHVTKRVLFTNAESLRR